MNIRNIKALAQILEAHGLSALEVTEGEERIRLERTPAQILQQMAAPAAHTAAVQPALEAAEAQELAPRAGAAAPGEVNFNDLRELKSPMVGVYYNAPAPDQKSFVQVGDRVKQGDVLCIIEAMKLMNEITAETDGEIVDICVENGQLVEYGQCLFKIY